MSLADLAACKTLAVSKFELTRQKPPDFGETEYLEATRAALAGVHDPKGQETKCEVNRNDFTAEVCLFLAHVTCNIS